MPPGAWLASAARSVRRGHQRATAVGDRLLPGAGWDGARSGVRRRLFGHRRRAIYRDAERRRRGTSPTVLRRGQWEAMHGTVSGWYENRPTRPRRATACWPGYGPPGTDLSAERSGPAGGVPATAVAGQPGAAEQSAGPAVVVHRPRAGGGRGPGTGGVLPPGHADRGRGAGKTRLGLRVAAELLDGPGMGSGWHRRS
jgi:hypothetical protein